MRRQAVGQRTGGTPSLGTIPASDQRAWRPDSWIGSVAAEPAASFGMPRTTRDGCQTPQLASNVVFAGASRRQTHLHGPATGPHGSYPWRATFSFVVCSESVCPNSRQHVQTHFRSALLSFRVYRNHPVYHVLQHRSMSDRLRCGLRNKQRYNNRAADNRCSDNVTAFDLHTK